MTLRVVVRVVCTVTGVNNMKTFLNVFGTIALAVGLMAIAGSANDCDGKCMEQANDFVTMLILAGTGVVFMLAGGFFMMVGNSE